MEMPVLKIGILNTDKKVTGHFNGEFILKNENLKFKDCDFEIIYDKKIIFKVCDTSIKSSRFEFEPVIYEKSSFTIDNVLIGINFHWEKEEAQTFKGSLKLIIVDDKLQIINKINIEDYLESVISSEMSANSHIELLKAHAIMSRSWVLANIGENKANTQNNFIENEHEIIKWYDRGDHKYFDLCADDHCQRYQGIGKIENPQAIRAVQETAGIVLKYGNEICDARFYKSCGGVTENYENVWDNRNIPYLQWVIDNDKEPEGFSFPLEDEENAKKWILSNPPAFCNITDEKILNKVLNDFDRPTKDFYRWTVKYTHKELSELIKQKSNIDFGEIIDIVPLKRGKSGRLYQIKIIGSKKEMIIGKELEIRKLLSPSHLYSSAFVVEKTDEEFIFHGAGWGHGAGLCQIGAAVMAERGYNYEQILFHYFKNTKLEKIY